MFVIGFGRTHFWPDIAVEKYYKMFNGNIIRVVPYVHLNVRTYILKSVICIEKILEERNPSI